MWESSILVDEYLQIYPHHQVVISIQKCISLFIEERSSNLLLPNSPLRVTPSLQEF